MKPPPRTSYPRPRAGGSDCPRAAALPSRRVRRQPFARAAPASTSRAAAAPRQSRRRRVAPGQRAKPVAAESRNSARPTGLQHASTAPDQPAPALRFGVELSRPAGVEPVVARAPVVLRHSPGGRDPAALLHAIERGIERAFFDLQDVVGQLLQADGDAVAVLGPARAP